MFPALLAAVEPALVVLVLVTSLWLVMKYLEEAQEVGPPFVLVDFVDLPFIAEEPTEDDGGDAE